MCIGRKIKIAYNPKGLKRIDNITSKVILPKQDLNPDNIVVKTENHYWKIDNETPHPRTL